jgi:hypothetical protein
MADEKHQCPKCQTEAHVAAKRCSKSECRTSLGLCSYCRKLSTFDGGRCGLCDSAVTMCKMNSIGANCNGYARTEGIGGVFCDRCRESASAVMRWGVGMYAATALLNAIRPKK